MTTILSFDVGIINLAYCLFTNEEGKLKILDWNIINLSDRESTKCHCGLKASFIQRDKYFCKVHSKKCEPIKPFEELFKQNTENKCTCIVKNNQCGRKSVYTMDNEYYCTTHSKTKYKSLVTSYKVKSFKNKSVGSMGFNETRLKLFQILDSKKHLFQCDLVLIENQPSVKNPTMKSIACAISDYYVIRGLVDKIEISNIKDVKFISPSNKLKLISNDITKKIDELKGNPKNGREIYKLTKQASVEYINNLIMDQPDWMSFFASNKKQDDLADSLLQALYFQQI